ncbi:hypothetical protein [Marinilabilia salmonicolor]|nr:hypothetical protein [Marinilabilia salmonicolor]
MNKANEIGMIQKAQTEQFIVLLLLFFRAINISLLVRCRFIARLLHVHY